MASSPFTLRERLRRKAWRIYTIVYAALHGIKVGRGVYIRPGARVRREGGGTITIGDNCHIHPGATILSYGGFVRLGTACSVNPYSVLYGHGGLTIGKQVRIATHCAIVPANHGFALNGVPIKEQPETKKGILIEDDVWVGAGARILDGAVIERGCVIAAGAVVIGRLTENGIYGGVPATLLKMRQPERRQGEPLTAAEYQSPSDTAAKHRRQA